MEFKLNSLFSVPQDSSDSNKNLWILASKVQCVQALGSIPSGQRNKRQWLKSPPTMLENPSTPSFPTAVFSCSDCSCSTAADLVSDHTAAINQVTEYERTLCHYQDASGVLWANISNWYSCPSVCTDIRGAAALLLGFCFLSGIMSSKRHGYNITRRSVTM